MISKQLLPMFVLAIAIFALPIGGLALLGCGNQRQVPGNVAEASDQTLSEIEPVGDASDVPGVSGISLVGDVDSSRTQEHVTQLVIPNPRQHVLSSGFPARSY